METIKTDQVPKEGEKKEGDGCLAVDGGSRSMSFGVKDIKARDKMATEYRVKKRTRVDAERSVSGKEEGANPAKKSGYVANDVAQMSGRQEDVQESNMNILRRKRPYSPEY